jgi:hydrogenase/urease accessory protein HupE
MACKCEVSRGVGNNREVVEQSPCPAIRSHWRWVAAVFVASFVPSRAEAHTAFDGLGSFWSGVLHVLTAVDQLGVLLGLAIWAGLQQRRLDSSIVGAVLVCSLLGAAMSGMLGLRFNAALLLSATMFLMGVAAASAVRIGAAWLLPVAAWCGALIGAANAVDSGGYQLGLFALGLSIAAASTVSYGLIGTAHAPGREWLRISFRVGASWIGATGLMVCALEYARLARHG